MNLTDILKRQTEGSKEEAKKVIEAAKLELSDDEMEKVSGGENWAFRGRCNKCGAEGPMGQYCQAEGCYGGMYV